MRSGTNSIPPMKHPDDFCTLNFAEVSQITHQSETEDQNQPNHHVISTFNYSISSRIQIIHFQTNSILLTDQILGHQIICHFSIQFHYQQTWHANLEIIPSRQRSVPDDLRIGRSVSQTNSFENHTWIRKGGRESNGVPVCFWRRLRAIVEETQSFFLRDDVKGRIDEEGEENRSSSLRFARKWYGAVSSCGSLESATSRPPPHNGSTLLRILPGSCSFTLIFINITNKPKRF